MADVTISEQEYRLIGDLLNAYCGLRFTPERAEATARRLQPRLHATGCVAFLDYYRLIKYGSDGEIQRAAECLANHETYFFREEAQLRLVQRLVAESRGGYRVLSAGCATGEEPYTLSMILDQAGAGGAAEIRAVDLSTLALEKARDARYAAHSFRGVESSWIHEYFEPDEGLLRLRDSLRRDVVFGQANLMDEASLAPLGSFDVILCRNVIIHFDQPAKVRALRNLTELLVPGGYLLLGHAETVIDVPCTYEMVKAGSAIGYRKAAGREATDGSEVSAG